MFAINEIISNIPTDDNGTSLQQENNVSQHEMEELICWFANTITQNLETDFDQTLQVDWTL